MAGDLAVSADTEFARFLCAQLIARQAVARAHAVCPPHALPQPPGQLENLAADLLELGFSPVEAAAPLSFDNGYEALGAAWVVSGSSLGNRAMLVRRRKQGLMNGNRFLSDPALAAYFAALLPVLDRTFEESEVASAVRGATLAFDAFEKAFFDCMLKTAA